MLVNTSAYIIAWNGVKDIVWAMSQCLGTGCQASDGYIDDNY